MSGEVEDMLCAAVRVGPWPVRELREILGLAGATGYQIRQAVTSATAAGDLTVLQCKFWVHPAFANGGWRNRAHYIEGHGRDQLIGRLSQRARPSSDDHHTPIDELMQGEDADRLAREDFNRRRA